MMRFLLPAVAGSVLAAGASAQTFEVSLGGRTIGTLAFDGGTSAGLRTELDGTPLGLGDGVFAATSAPVRTDAGALLRQYYSEGKGRTISVLTDEGRVVETVVRPESEETDMSLAANVPDGVLDPVQAFGVIVNAGGCPRAFRYYDGRRVVEVATAEAGTEGGVTTCDMSYRVVGGPGHLSPFRFRSLDVDLSYDATGLASASVGAGLFRVTLSR